MKLFSTSSLLIPIKLKITIMPVTPKIVFLLFKEKSPKKVVILESCSFLRVIFFVGAKFKRVGRRVKVMMKDMIRLFCFQVSGFLHPSKMSENDAVQKPLFDTIFAILRLCDVTSEPFWDPKRLAGHDV